MPILDEAGNLRDLKIVRRELKLSQSALSDLLGVSPRAVQSWEQGWRNPSSVMLRSLLLLLLASRLGNRFGSFLCWDIAECSESDRERCLAYKSGQGHLCWFLTGTVCRGQRLRSWSRKIAVCRDCAFFRRLMSEAGLSLETSQEQAEEVLSG